MRSAIKVAVLMVAGFSSVVNADSVDVSFCIPRASSLYSEHKIRNDHVVQLLSFVDFLHSKNVDVSVNLRDYKTGAIPNEFWERWIHSGQREQAAIYGLLQYMANYDAEFTSAIVLEKFLNSVEQEKKATLETEIRKGLIAVILRVVLDEVEQPFLKFPSIEKLYHGIIRDIKDQNTASKIDYINDRNIWEFVYLFSLLNSETTNMDEGRYFQSLFLHFSGQPKAYVKRLTQYLGVLKEEVSFEEAYRELISVEEFIQPMQLQCSNFNIHIYRSILYDALLSKLSDLEGSNSILVEEFLADSAVTIVSALTEHEKLLLCAHSKRLLRRVHKHYADSIEHLKPARQHARLKTKRFLSYHSEVTCN